MHSYFFVVARPVAHPVVVVVVIVFFHSCSFVVVIVVDVNRNRNWCGFNWWIVDYLDVVINRFPLGVLLVLGVLFLVGIVVLASLHSCGHVVSVCVIIDGFGYVIAHYFLKK